MTHFQLTDRGNAANEDFVRSTERYGIVIDGATGLAGDALFPERFATNAQWLSHAVGEVVCAALDAGAPAERAPYKERQRQPRSLLSPALRPLSAPKRLRLPDCAHRKCKYPAQVLRKRNTQP